jgi:hypothetical protein
MMTVVFGRMMMATDAFVLQPGEGRRIDFGGFLT